MNFGGVVLQENRPIHRLTEWNFWYDVIISRWRPWRHFTQKSAAGWRVHTASAGAYVSESASFWSIVHSYLLCRQSSRVHLVLKTLLIVVTSLRRMCGIPQHDISRYYQWRYYIPLVCNTFTNNNTAICHAEEFQRVSMHWRRRDDCSLFTAAVWRSLAIARSVALSNAGRQFCCWLWFMKSPINVWSRSDTDDHHTSFNHNSH